MYLRRRVLELLAKENCACIAGPAFGWLWVWVENGHGHSRRKWERNAGTGSGVWVGRYCTKMAPYIADRAKSA